ncbi:MAG: SPOR domain-containing protein [Nitrospirae bacterium]|nr:SPOR domain-containing protein [Nitrospirota bacterium]
MMGRISERSSILLLGRNSVVIGALLITVASFGIGYFLGYRGGGPSGQDKPIAESPGTREVLPIEDKRIIELPVAKEVLGKKAAEAPSQKPQEPAAAKPKADAGGTSSPKSSPEPNKSGANVAAAANKTQDDAAEPPVQAAGAAQAAPEAKAVSAPSKGPAHQHGKAIKKAKNRVASEKLYTVQMGAFPSKEGAEQLSQNLKANGYAPYIVGASGNNVYYKVRVGTFKNKQAAEKSAAALLKKTGLHNFVTAVQ